MIRGLAAALGQACLAGCGGGTKGGTAAPLDTPAAVGGAPTTTSTANDPPAAAPIDAPASVPSAPATTAAAATYTVRSPVGINLAGFNYYDRGYSHINLLQYGEIEVRDLASRELLAIGSGLDAQGWPTRDFATFVRSFDLAAGELDCSGEFTGQATVAVNTRDYAVLATAYDAATNRTTFTLRKRAGATEPLVGLSFTGTRRDAGAAANTGVTGLRIAAPGYRCSDIDTQVWTDDYIRWCSRFKALRTMDLTRTNSAWESRWSDARRRATHHFGLPSLDDAITLANRSGADLWINVPHQADDGYVRGLAGLLATALATERACYVEYSNELWNFSLGSQWGWLLDQAASEAGMFIGAGAGRLRAVAATRSGSIVTLTTSIAHGWQSGDVLRGQWGIENRYDPQFTVLTTPTPTSATFALTGPEGALSLGSGDWLFCPRRTMSDLVADGSTNVYAAAQRFGIRRLVAISRLFRESVGTSAMLTRFRPVWADQMAYGGHEDTLAWMAASLAPEPLSRHVHGHAGAPYFFAHPHQQDTSATQSQLVTALAANCRNARLNGGASPTYAFERRVALARHHGLVPLCYEGGVDVATDGAPTTGAAATVRNLAQFDPGLKQPIKDMLNDWFLAGGDLFCWYHGGLLPADGSGSGYGSWGLSDSYANLDAPKAAALLEQQTVTPRPSRNIAAAGAWLDGRGVAGVYPEQYPSDAPTFASYGGSDWTAYGGALWYVVFSPEARPLALTLEYTNANPYGEVRAATLSVNGSTVGTRTFEASASAVRQADFGVVTLRAGFNVLRLQRNAGQGPDVKVLRLGWREATG